MKSDRKTLEYYKNMSYDKQIRGDDPTRESWRGSQLFFKDSPAFRNLSDLVNTLDFDTDGNIVHVGNESLGILEVSERINEVFSAYRTGNQHPDLSKIPEQLRAAVKACLEDIDSSSVEK